MTDNYDRLVALAGREDTAGVQGIARKFVHPGRQARFPALWTELREAVEMQTEWAAGNLEPEDVIDTDEIVPSCWGQRWDAAESRVADVVVGALFELTTAPGSMACWTCNRASYGVAGVAEVGTLHCAEHRSEGHQRAGA